VGGTVKLGLFDLNTGQIVGTADVSPKVDVIAHDPTLHRVYFASGLGPISVVGPRPPKTHGVAFAEQLPWCAQHFRRFSNAHGLDCLCQE
jgi:hypothetical protein